MGASRWPESKPLWPSPLVDPSGFSSCSLPAHSLNSTIGTHLLVVFYLLSPIPTFIAKRYADDSLSSNPCRELAWFLTTGIVVSAFALPIVLARAPVSGDVTPTPVPPGPTSTTSTPPISTSPPNVTETHTVIEGGACGLVLTANSVMFLTILGFFIAFDSEDVEYSVW